MLDPLTREWLRDAATRDRRLRQDTGRDLHEIRAEITGMTVDEREDLAVDGYRWRHYQQPAQGASRAENAERERRRYVIDASHTISRMIGTVGPSYADLELRRAVIATPWHCEHSDCHVVITVEHPMPETVLCQRHSGEP